MTSLNILPFCAKMTKTKTNYPESLDMNLPITSDLSAKLNKPKTPRGNLKLKENQNTCSDVEYLLCL